MPKFKSAKRRRIGKRHFGLFLYVGAQLALRNRFEKRAHFRFVASGLKFNHAVTQISDGAGDVKTFRYLLHGIAEADALDVALVEDLNGSWHSDED